MGGLVGWLVLGRAGPEQVEQGQRNKRGAAGAGSSRPLCRGRLMAAAWAWEVCENVDTAGSMARLHTAQLHPNHRAGALPSPVRQGGALSRAHTRQPGRPLLRRRGLLLPCPPGAPGWHNLSKQTPSSGWPRQCMPCRVRTRILLNPPRPSCASPTTLLRQILIDAVVHAVNKDYQGMAEDFIKLGFLAKGGSLVWLGWRAGLGWVGAVDCSCPHFTHPPASQFTSQPTHPPTLPSTGTNVEPLVPALEKIWADSLGQSLSDFNFRCAPLVSHLVS